MKVLCVYQICVRILHLRQVMVILKQNIEC